MTNQIEKKLAMSSLPHGISSVTSLCRSRIAASALAILLLAIGAYNWGGGLRLAQAHPAGQSASGDKSARAKKLTASAIQIEPVENSEVQMPPEFRVAVYEHLIAEVTKAGKFQHVYRSGDRAAGDVPDLVTLHMKVKSFKQGSERTRAVTTVAGATSLNLGVQITGHDGAGLVDREVTGQVRFIGGNLRATYDFSKKVAEILKENF
jgi:hypothetical protein